MIRAAIIGLGWWGRTIVDSVQGKSDQVTFVAGNTRTRSKAEPLAAYGARVVDTPAELADCDIAFSMLSTWEDVKEVILGARGLVSGSHPGRGKLPHVLVECTSISFEGSAELREALGKRGVDVLAAPVSGNAKVVKAGKLSFVVSGPRSAFEAAAPYMQMIGQEASYVGEGDIARFLLGLDFFFGFNH